MRQSDITALIDPVLRIIRQAGDAVMAIYGAAEVGFQQKADCSPVTQADLAAHHILAEQLRSLPPGYPVVSEEDDSSLTHLCRDGCFWLIDPLDGTKEFLARNGEFTVNVALIKQGRSVFGAVYAPALDALYWGALGLWAYRKVGDETAAIRISQGGDDRTCRIMVSRSHLDAETQAFIDRLAPAALLSMGSSLKFCRLAEGGADLYPRLASTYEWDTAAAQAVLEGAGGFVLLHQDGHALSYGKTNALNPSFIATRDIALISND